VRLWVNGQLIINRWVNQIAEHSASIDLIAGQRYDIRLDYYESSGGAMIKLDWTTPNGTRTAVPTSALFTA
jgi:hypothetical protein